MRSLLLFLLGPTSFTISSCLGLHFPFVGRRSNHGGSGSAFKAFNVLAAMDDDNEIFTTRDVLYIANVTIDGIEYPLQLDTGSSDLWVNTTAVPTGQTQTTYNLTYGSGYAYGHIARGPVSFAGYNIPDQAYLNFESGTNPIFHFGAVGIVGLGFTTLSHIDAVVTSGSGTWGHSLLYNIFSLNPKEPNYIAMAFERTLDPTPEVQGSLGVGEVADTYAAVLSTEHIPVFPPEGATRWTVLLDSYAVDGNSHSVSSGVADVPSGRAAVLLDSGTTYSFAPPEVAASIYSSIPGARLDTAANQWFVPCSAGIRITLWINGKPYDIHPLDVVTPSLADSTQCVGTFIPQQASVGTSEFDWILGAAFLRSVYAVYDFGDFDSSGVMGAPYVMLLSTVNINDAANDFQTQRGGVVNVSNGNGNASPSVSIETTSDKIDKLISTIPLLFAILGANALILITILIIGIWLCCQYRRKTQQGGKKVAPLPLTTVATSSHAYEPVSTVDNDGRAATRPNTRLSRPLSRMSKHSLSGASIRDNLPELQSDNNSIRAPTRHSLLKPAINVSSEDVTSRRSSRIVPLSDSRRSSKLPRDSSPAPSHRKTPSPTGLIVDSSMLADDDDDSSENLKKDYHFNPPPPIVAPGYRKSMYSDMSASPTAAGSEHHFSPEARERTVSNYLDGPLPTTRNSVAMSPTETPTEDPRASYYSHKNVSFPGAQVFPTVQENPLQEALARAEQQEAQRAAFMASLNEPLPPPRRPREGGGSEDPRMRMSAYQTLSPTQEMAGARLNRHSFAAPGPSGAPGLQRSSPTPSLGQRRGPFVSTPSPFNPNPGAATPPSPSPTAPNFPQIPPAPPSGPPPNRPPPPPPA